jgi:hypothetical protein
MASVEGNAAAAPRGDASADAEAKGPQGCATLLGVEQCPPTVCHARLFQLSAFGVGEPPQSTVLSDSMSMNIHRFLMRACPIQPPAAGKT